MHSFHKQAFYVFGSICGTARHINSWKAGSPHIRGYNYVGEKNAPNLPKRQCQISIIKWYKLILRKVQKKEQFPLAGMTMGNTKEADF